MNQIRTRTIQGGPAIVLVSLAVCLLTLAGCGGKSVTNPAGGSSSGGGGHTVVTPPTAHFAPSRTEGDLPVLVVFTDESTGDVSSRSWNFGDGSAASSDVSPSHTYYGMGQFVVRLTLTGTDGSVSSEVHTIVVDRVVSVHTSPLRLGPFWPTHTGGDCDFGGNGPMINADVHFGISANGQQLLVYPHLRAAETKADWTTAESYFSPVPIVTLVSGGMRIKAVLGATSASTSYLSSGHSYTNVAGSTSMASFSILGDTDGDDVCNTTSDDTNMYVWINDYSYRIGP